MKTRINHLIFIVIMAILTISCVFGSEGIDISLYDENSPKKETMLNNPFAIQFNAKSEFDSISIYIANAVSSKEIELTLSLYKWEKDYKTTISKEPVVKEELNQYFKKKEWFSWKLNNTVQSAGEYILYIEKTGTWSLSFNITDKAIDNRVRLYEGGSARGGNMESRIHYKENNTLGEISDNNIFLFNDFDRFTATDGLGRTLPGYKEAGGRRENKYVGIFFHTWHDWDATRGTRNITEILKEYPDIKNDFNSPHWGTSPIFHWNEPLYNYYKNSDKWVLRKQAEMLANAGVDVIIFDNTNGTTTFIDVVEYLLNVFAEARNDGVKTPQISFMLPTFNYDDVAVQLRELYNTIYSKGRYRELWFYWKGKPLMLGYPGHLDLSDPADKEIFEFFTYRPTNHSHTWDNVQVRDANGNPTVYGDIGKEIKDNYIVWNWISIYPQLIAKNKDGTPEQVSVSVAQNWSKKRALTAMNGENVYGRHYSVKNEKYDERDNSKLYGINFEEQFEYAINIDPEFIFITGWNEWVAGRYEDFLGVPNAFPDQFNDEYSRDIEPSLGDLKDHYYYQMVKYIRLFKGVSKPYEVSKPKTIDIYADTDQWDDVFPEYYAYPGNTIERNSRGYLNNETGKYYEYKNTTGRNDFKSAKIARDNDNIYFMVECTYNISSAKDSKWMRLLIDVNGSENNNWETFNYLINRESPSDKAVLEKCTGGWNWEKVCDVEYNLKGNRLQIKVPKAMLGITDDNMTINFKWSDNMQNDGDIMDFYLNGDTAPGGRFKYCYTTIKSETVKNKSFLKYLVLIIILAFLGVLYILFNKRRKRNEI